MSDFTKREVALDCFKLWQSVSLRPAQGGSQWNGDTVEYRQARRRELSDRAVRACVAALAGPPKIVLSEPDDDALQRMLDVLAHSNEG